MARPVNPLGAAAEVSFRPLGHSLDWILTTVKPTPRMMRLARYHAAKRVLAAGTAVCQQPRRRWPG